MKSRIKMHKTYLATILFFGFALVATPLSAKSIEKSKKVNKVFQVSGSQSLNIENKFGDVNISTWDKNEVQVDIEVLVEQKNEDKAQKILDRIQIEIKESKDEISIITDLGNDDYKTKVDDKKKLEVNYTLKMPVSMALELENQFGDITIDRLTGSTDIEVQFGSASIGELKGSDHELTFKFSDPVIIAELGGGEITLKFSKLVIEKAGEIELNSQMSNSEIGELKKSSMKVSYGSMKVDKIDGLELKSSMSNITIGDLQKGGEFDVQYGKLNIDQLSKEFKNLTIDAKFSPVVVGVESGAIFELDANTKMSKLNLPSGYKAKDASEYVNNEYFKGRIGSDGDGSLPLMKITNQFGNVEIR